MIVASLNKLLDVIKKLIERGYPVRGTVRSLSDKTKVGVLKELFPTVCASSKIFYSTTASFPHATFYNPHLLF